MDEQPFRGRAARPDLNDAFPADLIETRGPALLGESRATTAALVGAQLLRLVARAGGTRVKPSAADRAIDLLARVVSEDAQRWCEDEARRIAHWCVDEPDAEPEVDGDRGVMASADRDARVAVIAWAIQAGLDVELEWYDETEDRWPRLRATPLRTESADGEDVVVVKTALADIVIPIANLRWLMPVERRVVAAPKVGRVLAFPTFGEEE